MSPSRCVAIIFSLLCPIPCCAQLQAGPPLYHGTVGWSAIFSRPMTVAAAPMGETLLAWRDGAATGANASIQYVVLDRAGQPLFAPRSVPKLPSENIATVSAAASAYGFLLAYGSTAGLDPYASGISYVTIDLAGNLIIPVPLLANVQFDMSEREPSCAGTPDGTFAVAWLRTGQSPQGVHVRRFRQDGIPIDPVEIRVDPQSSWYWIIQDRVAVGMWPTGEVVVTWHEGGIGLIGMPGPDGFGLGVVARWFDNTLAPLNPDVIVVNTFVHGDQGTPRVATDHFGRCVIAWHEIAPVANPAVRYRRFGPGGTPLWVSERAIVPALTGTATRAMPCIAGDPGGDFAISWHLSDTVNPYLPTVAEMARFGPAGDLAGIIPLVPVPAGHATGENEIAMDQWGNIHAVFEATAPGPASVLSRRFQHVRIGPTSPPSGPGASVALQLDTWSDEGVSYAVALSLGEGPILAGWRAVKLDADAVFWLSITPGNPVLFPFIGAVNLLGPTAGPTLAIPPYPFMSGVGIKIAFVTFDPALGPALRTISDTTTLSIP